MASSAFALKAQAKRTSQAQWHRAEELNTGILLRGERTFGDASPGAPLSALPPATMVRTFGLISLLGSGLTSFLPCRKTDL
jgi:hypothetical protein